MNYEFLRPDELRKLQTASPLAFLPFGPLEWHGPHLPIGTDGLIAQALSEQLGGVLLPTLFAGGAAPLGIPMCRTFGLPDSKKDAVGMDFAPNAFPSIYLKEPTLEALLNDYVDGLVAQGYRLIGLISGHGGAGHTPVLERICARSHAPAKVVWYPSMLPFSENDPNSGHATVMETAVQMALCPKRVALDLLPPVDQKIICAQYGIIDDRFFRGDPTPDKSVYADPRIATPELGKRYFEYIVENIRKQIQTEWKDLLK